MGGEGAGGQREGLKSFLIDSFFLRNFLLIMSLSVPGQNCPSETNI